MQYQVIRTYEYKQVVSVEADSEENAIHYSMYAPLSMDDVDHNIVSIEVQTEPIWQMQIHEYN